MAVKQSCLFTSGTGVTLVQTTGTAVISGGVVTLHPTSNASWNTCTWYMSSPVASVTGDLCYVRLKRVQDHAGNSAMPFCLSKAVSQPSCVANTDVCVYAVANNFDSYSDAVGGGPFAATADTYYDFRYTLGAGNTALHYKAAADPFVPGSGWNALVDWGARDLSGFDLTAQGSALEKINNTDYVIAWFAYTDSNGLTPPTVTAGTATATGQTTIAVTWTDVATTTNATGISIERDGVEVDTVAIGVEEFEDTGLDPDTEYDYLCRAYFDLDGTIFYGSYSATMTATTDSPPDDDSGDEAMFLFEMA